MWKEVRAAGRPQADPGCSQPRDQRRRAPRAHRGAARPARRARRARERPRGHRLRVRAGTLRAAGASFDPVGEAAGDHRRRPPGQRTALRLTHGRPASRRPRPVRVLRRRRAGAARRVGRRADARVWSRALGSNGAGKKTLLRAISGSLRGVGGTIVAGTVELDGPAGWTRSRPRRARRRGRGARAGGPSRPLGADGRGEPPHRWVQRPGQGRQGAGPARGSTACSPSSTTGALPSGPVCSRVVSSRSWPSGAR